MRQFTPSRFRLPFFKLSTTLLILGSLFFSPSISTAALKDFKKNVDEERNRKAETASPSGESDDCGFGCQLVFMTFQMLFFRNSHTYYDCYPYAGSTESWATFRSPEIRTRKETKVEPSVDEKTVIAELITVWEYDADRKLRKRSVPRYEKVKLTPEELSRQPKEIVSEIEVVETIIPAGKRFFFNMETAGFFLDRETYGFGGAFQSRFWGVLGASGEYRQWRDASDILIFRSVGLDIAVFQLIGFSLSGYAQHNEFSSLIDLAGNGLGLRAQVFIFKPLALDLRIGKISMPDIVFLDTDLRFGVFIDRVQVYFGYRSIRSELAALEMLQSGLQFWF